MKNSIKKGFTLVELLFVMAIVAILAGFAIANLKDSTTVATVNSIKNDVKNAVSQQQTYFAANQDYTTVTAANGAYTDLNNGMITTVEGVKITVSKGNTIETQPETCDDNSVGFSVTVSNAKIAKQVSYNSCTDGTMGNVEDLVI